MSQAADRSRASVTPTVAAVDVTTDGATELYDRVVKHLFSSGLDIASILSQPTVNDGIRARLLCVIDELDSAITELRVAALTAACDDARVGAPSLPAPATTRPQTETPEKQHARRRLRRVIDDEVFAYTLRGHDFYRVRDHELWAHESDGILFSAGWGTQLARRVGDVFYDATGAPLYYEIHDAAAGAAQPWRNQPFGMLPALNPIAPDNTGMVE